MRNFITYHIIPITIVFGLTFSFFYFINKPESLYIQPYTPVQTGILHANYSDGINSELDLIYALKNNSLIEWGSSEVALEDTIGYQLYNFFPTNFNIPTIAIGHAGNQCFSIYCQIAALSQYARGSKMVFIVSPGWFTSYYAKGTSTASFLEFNNNRFLKSLYLSNIPKIYKEYVSKYIYNHQDDITSLSYFMRKLMYLVPENRHNINYPINYIFDNITSTLYPKYGDNPYWNYSINECKPITINHKTINWDSLRTSARTDFKLISTNNNVAINNKYYNKYVKGKTWEQTVVERSKNNELDDFKMLVSLINHLQIEPVFVIQNLNPFVYKNLLEIKPIIDEITSITKTYNYPTLNMVTYSTNQYDFAELTDLMHFGNLGLIKVNEFVYNNLYKNETTIQPK